MSKKEISLEERLVIEEQLKWDKSFSHIGNLLNRDSSTINREINRNGGRLEYNAIKASERAIFKGQIKEQNLIKNVSINVAEYGTRIENLEMQIEIILDELNKLTKKG